MRQFSLGRLLAAPLHFADLACQRFTLLDEHAFR